MSDLNSAVANSSPIQLDARPMMSLGVVVALLGFCIFAFLDLELANRLTLYIKDKVLNYFDWLLIAAVNAAFLAALTFVFHPRANPRLGQEDERPEFSRLA